MYVNLIFVLCGISALANADSACDCNVLKQCVDKKRTDMKTEFDGCHDTCQNQLGAAASAVQKCYQQKKQQLAPFEEKMHSCIFNPTTGLCGTTPAQTQASNSHGKSREHRGQRQHHHEGLLGDKMKPYKDCMKQCFHDKHPEQAKLQQQQGGAGAGNRTHPRHHHAHWLVKKCADEQSCTINKEVAKAAGKACKAQSGLTKEQNHEMKKNLCECLRTALEIDPTQMSCDRPADHKAGEDGSHLGN